MEVGDLRWKETYPEVIEMAKEVLGETRGGHYREKESWWWNEEVQVAVKDKKEAFKRWKKTREEEDRVIYTNLNKISKTEVAKAKDIAYEQLYKDIEEKGPKIIYKLAETRQRRAKDIDRLTFVKDKEGNVMCEDDTIKSRWKEYFNTLLNTKNKRKVLPETEPVQGPIENIRETEVKVQLNKMAA